MQETLTNWRRRFEELITKNPKLRNIPGYLMVRPSPKRKPNNVLIECIDTGERWISPWRGLRRVKP